MRPARVATESPMKLASVDFNMLATLLLSTFHLRP